MSKKGGNPQNFKNPKKIYAGMVGARVEPHLFEFLEKLPHKTDWIREAIAEKYEREQQQAG